MNEFMTYSAFGLGLSQLIFVFNFLVQPGGRPQAPGEPVARNTLEWTDAVAAAALQLRDDPDGLPRGLRVQRARAWPTTYLPQTEPRPAEAGPLDPVMA